MGKKRSVTIGAPKEQELKVKHAVKLEQKKLREGRQAPLAKTAKVPGMGGGQRVVDSAEESLREYEELQKRQAALETHVSPTSQAPAAAKPARAAKIRSQAYRTAKSQVDSAKLYHLPESIELLRKITISKVNDTVELHLILKSKPANNFKVALPHAAGPTKKVAVFTDALLKDIEAGKLDFDLLVASPDDMPKLVKYAKVLGPRGLMPNPKTGTISSNPAAAAKKLAADTSTILKLDKSAPVIHTTVGKLSLKDQDLNANISAVLACVSGNLKKAVLKSTMSPAIKLEV